MRKVAHGRGFLVINALCVRTRQCREQREQSVCVCVRVRSLTTRWSLRVGRVYGRLFGVALAAWPITTDTQLRRLSASTCVHRFALVLRAGSTRSQIRRRRWRL